MDSVYLHLVLSHIPVLGIGFGILILAYGFVTKSDEVKKLALLFFILAAIVAIPVYLTGDPAEEIVEHLAGVVEAAIDPHEDAAYYSLIFMEITGVLALLNLLFFSRSFGKKFVFVTLLSAVIAAGSIVWTASLGGKIRHTEIIEASSQTITPDKKTETEHKDDDDEH